VALKVIHGWENLPSEARGAALAFGNFDGVHLGHRQVIQDAQAAALNLKLPFAVSTFEPHPRRIFQPQAEPFQLMNLDQQARALEVLGVELFYVLPFGDEIAGMSDEAFAETVLAQGLGVRHVAVGFDVTFGKDRTGDVDSLARYGRRLGFTVSVAKKFGDADNTVGETDPELDKYSSSAVRDALHAGDADKAAKVMGRPFAIEGVVVKGQQLGRTLGFPTANVGLGDYVRPRLGIYATRTRLPDGRTVPGVANLGRNPTTGLVEARLEVFLFDFDEELYGQVIETELLHFIRPELKFDSVDAMTEQMRHDEGAARAYLAAHPS
jgi:riboflavin kinase / FMN adenylyltransferase